jgi:GTP-binding protein
MKSIISAEFIKGVVGTDPILKEKIPQIAFVGRSNVGKSSVINALTGTKGLAISSSTPGRTLQLNFFLINNAVYLVDLPGYGYAKASLAQAEKMRKMIMWYLEHNEYKPTKVVLIIDGNVGPKKFDSEMMELLSENGYEIIVVANKMDKVKASELIKKQRVIMELLDSKDIIYFSSKTKKGKDELLEKILS